MTRIFHAVLTKRLHVTVAGESLEEVEGALRKAEKEDEIEDLQKTGWSIEVDDPIANTLRRTTARPDAVPTTFDPPDHGVVNGYCVPLGAYVRQKPDYLTEVEKDAHEAAQQLHARVHNAKLPGIK
jgi:hypothetical protein